MPATVKKISDVHHVDGRFTKSSGFGIATYREGGRLGPRWQPHYQLVVMHRGSVTVRVDGASLSLKAGMGILLAPGHVEAFQFSRRVQACHSWCHIVPEDLPERLKFPATVFHRAAKCPPQVISLVRLGLQANRMEASTAAGNHTSCCLALAAIWAFVASLGEERSERSLNQTALAKFHSAVGSLGSRPISLTSLAGQCGVSAGHLTKLVREHLGTTPMEVVWRSRVTRAARALSETGLSVAEVADQTGFANAYHFSRRFRQQFGQSPRAWRIAAWGTTA